ncbi:DUF1353 domain-containing protein [Sphingobacterium anhuiense]|uniref:DUF1353 domain-containing protein n=1 Tax=Sphingobacterium anhuiense TaxID=493780 RepID=UPI003C300B1E
MKYFILILLFPVFLYGQANKNIFVGNVMVQWLDDGRSMKLQKQFGYIDQNGKLWNVPKNTVVDGASIPKAFWTIVGGPYEGKYRNASVVHDHYCVIKTETWQDVHKMFYNACITGGTPVIKAKLMYSAVLAGGPRWEISILKDRTGQKIIVDKEANITADEMKAVKEWIETTNPSIEEINARMEGIVIETYK